MDMSTMQMLNQSANVINSTSVTGFTTATGAVVGGVLGSIVPGVGTTVGAGIGGAIGSLVGGITNSFIPAYSTIKGASGGINFTVLQRKPYWIEYHCPTREELEKLDKIYKYYGCATNRTEPLNIKSYTYQGHAYVKGDLHYNGTIPLKYFKDINAIFNKGVHILQ